MKSEIAGTIVEKEVTLGEFVPEGRTIFVVGDLSSVWLDLNVYRQDFSQLQLGQTLYLEREDGRGPIESTISYISPVSSASSQTMLARAVVPNPRGDLRPGLFVTCQVVIGEVDALVAVSGKIAVDRVLRMENSQEDFAELRCALGLPSQEVPCRNWRWHRHYSYYYNESALRLVEKYLCKGY